MNNSIQIAVGSHLQNAIDRIKDLGLSLAIPDVQPITRIIDRISDVDQEKVLVIGRTMATMQAFDALVAENLNATNYGERFNAVTEGFDSIIADARKQIAQEEKGSVSFSDRIGNVVMKFTRGDIADRFTKIEGIYKSVITDSGKTIELQSNILEAYVEARLALKEGEIAAFELYEKMKAIHESAKLALRSASDAIEKAAPDMPAPDRARLELARDKAANELSSESDRLQLAKDLSEMLTVSYSVTETIFGKYSQAHQVLDRLNQKAVLFFNIQRPVMTAMKATYTGILVVNELSRTQTAMEDGLNRSLEGLASLGDSVIREGVRVAHAPGIKASAVKALVDSTVNFQMEVGKIVAENQQLATVEAENIRLVVEAGKDRLAKFANREA